MVTIGDWKPRKAKRKKVKFRGKYISGGFPMGLIPGTGGLPDGGIDGGAVMGEGEEDNINFDASAEGEENLSSEVSDTNQDEPSDIDPSATDEPHITDDPDRQGVIRIVPKAHLVYKRATPDGQFEELWIYNTSPTTPKAEMEIKHAILAGTDIPLGKNVSEDGESSYEMVKMGNVAMIKIIGLVQ